MVLISVPVAGYAPPRWTPVYAAPRASHPGLGDASTVPTASLSFIDSPMVALVSDVAAASAIAMLGYSFYKGKSAWSNVFFGLAVLFGAKAIVDIKRLQ